jgi:pimeloyl-ACP methyl ester carboxylesterase
VLQHGFSDNGMCWAPTARELEADWDVVMPDARAHGKSARVQPGEAIDQAADLAALIRALDLAPCVVAGHSMGAWMASELGARVPELVRGIVLEDPPWFPPRPEGPEGGLRGRNSPLAEWLRGMTEMSLDEIVTRERVAHPTWPEEVLRAWCAAKLELDLAFLEIGSTARMDWHEVVAALKCPTLVITADPAQGGIVTPEVAAEAQALNPLIQVVNFPGVGHHIRFAVFGPYMAAVKAFLAEL